MKYLLVGKLTAHSSNGEQDIDIDEETFENFIRKIVHEEVQRALGQLIEYREREYCARVGVPYGGPF